MEKLMFLMIFIQVLLTAFDSKIVLSKLRPSIPDFLLIAVAIPTILFFSSNQMLIVILNWLVNLIYIFLIIRDLKKSVIVNTLVLLICLITDHLVNLLQLFPTLNSDLTYTILFIPTNLVIVFVVNLIIKKFKRTHTNRELEVSNYQFLISSIVLLTLISLVIYTEVLQGNKDNINTYNLVIFILISFILLIIQTFQTNELKKKYQLQKQELQIKNDNRYIQEMERHYNELRKFRHDYQNTLLSLDEYIRTNDMAGLKKYYQELMVPISGRLKHGKYSLEDLSKINDKEIKSILFNKLYTAQMEGIKVEFESQKDINDFYTNTLDLVIAIGIILDNALEETQKQTNGFIKVGIMSDDSEIILVFQNSFGQSKIPVWQMKQAGFSTKGTNRGLGLSNLSEIINRNNNMTLETMIESEYFLQKITIEKDGERND